MAAWIAALMFLTGVAAGLGIRRQMRLRQLRAKQRRIEQPNSYYSAPSVRRLVNLERWTRIPLDRLHPLNRDEAKRLLRLARAAGPDALSRAERQFLDNMERVWNEPDPSPGWLDPAWMRRSWGAR